MSHSIRKRNRRRRYHEQTLQGAFNRAWKQGLRLEVVLENELTYPGTETFFVVFK